MTIQENFCTACLSVPIALAGGSMGIYGGTSKTKSKRIRIILIVSGVITLLTALYLYKSRCASNTCSY